MSLNKLWLFTEHIKSYPQYLTEVEKLGVVCIIIVRLPEHQRAQNAPRALATHIKHVSAAPAVCINQPCGNSFISFMIQACL